MSNTPPDNAVEQRRKVLKGALAASGVVTMGYSGPALASFQCVTSTSAVGLDGFKRTISSSSNWAWLEVQVYFTTTATAPNVWKAVKVPNGSDPLETTDVTTYFFDNGLDAPTLDLPGVGGIPADITAGSPDTGTFAFVIIYFKTDGSIAGFYPKYVPSGSGYPAQGSCLTSLNPSLDRTNISYGG